MKTNRPISTISYNTDNFLLAKLELLKKQGVIEFYAFVNHLPEPKDERGLAERKKHKHLFIVPSQVIDTISEKWKETFSELTSDSELPLNCIQWQSSKFIDWYLYALHDTAYLALKGQTRYYHYKHQDIFNSDSDYFLELIHTSDVSKVNQFKLFTELCEKNISFSEMVKNGFIPIQQIRAYERAYNLITGRLISYAKDKGQLEYQGYFACATAQFVDSCTVILRNGGKTHEVDTETGEIK